MPDAVAADAAKRLVHDFWNEASCGEAVLLHGRAAEAYAEQRRERYRLEPLIPGFASFEQCRGLTVLEIGVGLGADHESFAAARAKLYGIDLTPRAIEHTRARLAQAGLASTLGVADAEALPFPDGHFDLVYSWGVLHHSPDTQQALDEVWRVLRPGGTAKLMIYHAPSVVGLMLWTRYALMAGKPWRSLANVYAEHLESPGTQAFTVEQARAMCSNFESVTITTVLSHGDLLTSKAGARHDGVLLRVARLVWPRRLIRRWFPQNGLFMLITATKSAR
jgi:ubiquinone/menaquinone biosynthesis C-methylase UbiE